VLFGLKKVSINSISEEIVLISKTGPHWKAPAIAPIEVATAGTVVVKSISETFTPGLS
jgi:hypothetical protein